jgi:hypothetical protein
MKHLQLRQIIKEEISKVLNESNLPQINKENRIKRFNESEENLNVSDVRQRFINLVEDRINDLEREMNYTKQGQEFYDKLQERIDELTDLLSDMRYVV